MRPSSDGRRLPIAPAAAPARRSLPLLEGARDVDRQARPIYAVWEITLACDLACRHCGSRAGRARPDELSTAECLDLVDQMAALGVKEVTLIGGEAYLRDDWLDLVRRIRERGMQATMTTGGRGITPERARAAKDAGLMSVSVSVDGLEETHDMLRAVRGSFQSAFDAMARFREAGVPVAANTQIGRTSLGEIPELFERLADVPIHGWQVQLTTAMGRAGDQPELLLEPYQVLEVHPMLARLKRRARERKVRLLPGNNVGYFGPLEHILRAEYPGQRRGKCGAGRTTLGIEANGDVKGCPSLTSETFVGGNVREHPLVDLWERTAPLRFMRDATVERSLQGHCRSCYYGEACMGGCSWTSEVLFGQPGDNPFCHHRALTLLERGVRERLERVAEAPGVPFDRGLFRLVEEPWPEDELPWAHAMRDAAEALARGDEGA